MCEVAKVRGKSNYTTELYKQGKQAGNLSSASNQHSPSKLVVNGVSGTEESLKESVDE